MNHHTEWTEAKNRLIQAVSSSGFSQKFGEVMARQLGSPKAIDRTTSYVYHAKPRTEEMPVDEMLAMNEAFSRLNEYYTIFVWVFEKNERTIRFNHKYGFEFDGCKNNGILAHRFQSSE